MIRFELCGKVVNVFGKENKGSPLVILNTFEDEGEAVWNECLLQNCLPFTLAAISCLDWNKDMSPWQNPPIYKNDTAFLGGADSYLDELKEKIIPSIRSYLSSEPAYIALAGYSLAGLFALYAAHKTSIFSRVASVSASLWYPRFAEYAKSTAFIKKPDYIYLSLGDTEAKTRNALLKTVQEKTEALYYYWQSRGIAISYELNKGNHFTNTTFRTARGIQQLLLS